MACQFSHPKLRLLFEDAAEFVKNSIDMFDVIINDSTDRKHQDGGDNSNSNPLFQLPYWQNVKRALRPRGIVVQQEESIFFDMSLVKEGLDMCRPMFPSVNYAYAYISSFCGGHGFRLCSINPDIDFTEPVRKWTSSEREKLNLRYYNERIHKAAFVLPEYAAKALNLPDDNSTH